MRSDIISAVIRNLKNFYHLLSAFGATVFYRFPAKKLFVIGVTGTDGKTTVVHLIFHILKTAGKKTAMISTVSAPGFHVTTPNSWQLQRFLRKMANEGKKYIVLEATSHGLDQHRLFGCYFQIGVITNVTHEHLDYHVTWENYLKAKSRLFKSAKHAVLNRDDESFPFLKRAVKAKIITYGIKNKADFTPQTLEFKTKLPGEYNLYNCLAAISVARILKIPDEKIRQALLTFPAVKGRMETVNQGQGFRVIIDFAHTPNAFRRVLATAREMTKGRLIHVFGCTGDRDRTKRPMMGEISTQFSDRIILTHEDTYSEDLKQIISEIESGVKKGAKVLGKDYWKVYQRKKAIEKAIKMAKKSDTVLITGVGHQEVLNIGDKEVPWSDLKVVSEILKRRK